MKLREARKLVDKALARPAHHQLCIDPVNDIFVMSAYGSRTGWIETPLPAIHLGSEGPKKYSKRLDQLIAKHGPNHDLPTVKEKNENLSKPAEPDLAQHGSETSWKPDRESEPFRPPSGPGNDGASILEQVLKGNFQGSEPDSAGVNPLPQPPNKRRAKRSGEIVHAGNSAGPGSEPEQCTLPGGQSGRSILDRQGDRSYRIAKSDKPGVDTPVGAGLCDSLLDGLKAMSTYFGGRCPNPHNLPDLKSIPEASTEAGELSTEDRFRKGNPGGACDMAMAALEGEHLRKEARSIAKAFGDYFRNNEVSVSGVETPRISGKKLIRELVSSSYRMSRTKREELSPGLKLILVDISPSCAAIRDKCMAAALSLASNDSNIVVIAHFNGWMDSSGDNGYICGTRASEVAVIEYSSDTGGPELGPFEAFLETGKVSGCVAFGDYDASSLYQLIAAYAPLLWMNPDWREAGMDRYKPERLMRSGAGLTPVAGVTDAKSAVIALRERTRKQ